MPATKFAGPTELQYSDKNGLIEPIFAQELGPGPNSAFLVLHVGTDVLSLKIHLVTTLGQRPCLRYPKMGVLAGIDRQPGRGLAKHLLRWQLGGRKGPTAHAP